MCIDVLKLRIKGLSQATDLMLSKWEQTNNRLAHTLPPLTFQSHSGAIDRKRVSDVALAIILEYSLSLDVDANYLAISWTLVKQTMESLGGMAEEMAVCSEAIQNIFMQSQRLQTTINEAKALLAPPDGSWSDWWKGHNQVALQQRLMAAILPPPSQDTL